jgi:putative Mn2+ efflux pump MntP
MLADDNILGLTTIDAVGVGVGVGVGVSLSVVVVPPAVRIIISLKFSLTGAVVGAKSAAFVRKDGK